MHNVIFSYINEDGKRMAGQMLLYYPGLLNEMENDADWTGSYVFQKICNQLNSMWIKSRDVKIYSITEVGMNATEPGEIVYTSAGTFEIKE